MCAKYAIRPPCALSTCGEITPKPCMNCVNAHRPITNIAGTLTTIGKQPIGTIARTWFVGNLKMYAPSTPAIAPEAQIEGTWLMGATEYCAKAASVPHVRYNAMKRTLPVMRSTSGPKT